MKKRTKQNGSNNDHWETKDYILKAIREEFGDFFDPCPLRHDITKWDGLKVEWKKVNFINPPYNNKDKVAFIEKAFNEWRSGKTCIMLLPLSIELPVYQDIILPYAKLIFVRGRIKFKGFNSKGKYVTNHSGQGGSMFAIFDNREPKERTLTFLNNNIKE